MTRTSRLVVALASLLLLAVYVTPLWRIELVAPQYPEGLGLRIWVNQITGLKPNDLNSINGLNHYIGMRAIDPSAIPELRFMPQLLAAAVAAGLVVALVGRRGLLYAWAGLFTLGAAVGLGDFWKWGYEYGHQLDPHAAIKVPGMSYQPPVIGPKTLLNFRAESWPDLGGLIAIAVVGAAGLPERYEQLAALPYVEACANETMRLKPVAPIIMAQPTRDTEIAGVQVPKKTLVMCLMRAGAIDERRFADAKAFEPARWFSGAQASSPKRVSMPFGAGPRLCPGRYLAILEMKMVMAMLLSRYEIESVATPDGGEAREHLAFTMAPAGLRLRLREKARAAAPVARSA